MLHQLLADTDVDLQKELGYSLGDMMIECSYDGKTCTERQEYFFWKLIKILVTLSVMFKVVYLSFSDKITFICRKQSYCS